MTYYTSDAIDYMIITLHVTLILEEISSFSEPAVSISLVLVTSGAACHLQLNKTGCTNCWQFPTGQLLPTPTQAPEPSGAGGVVSPALPLCYAPSETLVLGIIPHSWFTGGHIPSQGSGWKGQFLPPCRAHPAIPQYSHYLSGTRPLTR